MFVDQLEVSTLRCKIVIGSEGTPSDMKEKYRIV